MNASRGSHLRSVLRTGGPAATRAGATSRNFASTHGLCYDSGVLRRLLSSLFSLIGLAVVAYVWFFVPIGRRTLHEHALRIAETEPAQELGVEVEDASERLVDHVAGEWDARYRGDAGTTLLSGP